MPNFNNLGNQQPYFKNQFRNSEQGKFSNSYTHEQACIFSNSLISIKRKCCFFCCWLKAVDKEAIRLATKDKKPQYRTGSNWPNIKEKRRVQELLSQYGELGTRTGKRLGRKWYVRVDLDLLWLSETLRGNLERGFIMMMKRRGVIFIKTKKGYHVILLLDKLPPSGSLYNVDKFGVKRKIGDILSVGRQAQDLGSPEKEQPTSEGKWFWQAKDIQEVSEIFAKYFLLIECKEKVPRIRTDFANPYPNINQVQKLSKITNESQEKKSHISQKSYIKLAQILKWEFFQGKVKRDKPIYKLWFRQTGKSPRYFLLDTYQKHKEIVLDQMTVGSVNNFILNQGQVYQFFYGFG